MPDKSPPRTLGKQESYLFSSLSAAGHTVFTTEDARAVLGDSNADVPNLLHRLNRKLDQAAGAWQVPDRRLVGGTVLSGLRHRATLPRLYRVLA